VQTDIRVRKPNDVVTMRLKDILAAGVRLHGVFAKMYFAVNLDDKINFLTEKVHDVATQHVLTPDLVTAKLPIAKS
jgi:hypothetical protein